MRAHDQAYKSNYRVWSLPLPLTFTYWHSASPWADDRAIGTGLPKSTSAIPDSVGKETSMKKWLLALIFFSSAMCSVATTLNAMEFESSESQKKQVIESITATVKIND